MSRIYDVLPPLPHIPSRYMSCLYLCLVIILITVTKNGSLNMLECKKIGSLMSSQGTALLSCLLDLSWPWKSLDRIHEEGLDGWLTSVGYGLVTPHRKA